MKLKVTMEEKTTLHRPLDNVLMYSEGDPECLRSLMTALETVKSECNAEANREGKPLSAYDLRVSLPR